MTDDHACRQGNAQLRLATRLVVGLAALAFAAPLAAQNDAGQDILGMWHAAARVLPDGRTEPVDHKTQVSFWIAEVAGGLSVNSGLAWSSVPIARRGDRSFETLQGQSYRLIVDGPDQLTLEGDGRHLRFDREAREFVAPVPEAKGDDITFKAEWASRQWFDTLRQRFAADHGRGLEACFSDAACLSACPVAAATCQTLRSVVAGYIEADAAQDPLFVDRSAAFLFDRDLLGRREQFLRFRRELDAAKTRSLAASREATRTFFKWLAVDTDTDTVIVEATADDRDQVAEMVEVVGCTLAGFVPIAGDVVATQCGLKAATGVATSASSLAGDGLRGISLQRVMQALIDAEVRYHELAFEKNEPILVHALSREEILVEMVEWIRDGRLAVPQQVSGEDMQAAMWATVWPYALHGYAIGPASRTDILTGARDAACARDLAAGTFATSVHEHLVAGATNKGVRSTDQFARFRWSLRIGGVTSGRPLEAAALASLERYLARSGTSWPQVFVDFKAAGRLFVESRYNVDDYWNWFPPIKYENMLLFGVAPGVIRYQDEALRTLGVAEVGQSVAKAPGRNAIGRLLCASFAPL